MLARAVSLLLSLLAALGLAGSAGAQTPAPAARALLAAWHEEPARIDRARSLLEAAAGPEAVPETLVELARVWFLTGDFRARSDAERAGAYERGAAVARRAIAAAPRDDRAHLWLAINSGRSAELKGVMRALALVGVVREGSEAVLKLNPRNVEGLILAAGLAAEMPALMGGDRVKAEALFRRALEIDPHHTGARLELARLYMSSRRWRDAERELNRVVAEPAPTDLPRWTTSERSRARAVLADLHGRGLASGSQVEAP